MSRLNVSDLMISTKQHQDLITAFEKLPIVSGCRLDKELKKFWKVSRIYQDAEVNQQFVAFRYGYAIARQAREVDNGDRPIVVRYFSMGSDA